MKLISQKPVLTLTLEEKNALIEVEKILDKLTNYNSKEVDELLEDYGEDYESAIKAYQVIDNLLEASVTPNSVEAKSMALSHN